MGECYFCIARNMASSINRMKNLLEEDKQEDEKLTLSVPFGFSHTTLLPKVVRFLKLYPEIDLLFNYDDKRHQFKSSGESVANAYIRRGDGDDNRLNHTYFTSQVDRLYGGQITSKNMGYLRPLKI
jgi:DNA-binding transcriptional LysR family regulator